MREIPWIQWMSIKHTDCRRPSGVGKNISKLHIAKPGDDLHALCGKEIQIKIDGPFIRPEQHGKCGTCLRAWQEHFVERSAYDGAFVEHDGDGFAIVTTDPKTGHTYSGLARYATQQEAEAALATLILNDK